jgi:hypothetical protein
MDWNRVIFSDEATVRLNQLQRYMWNLSGKKKVVRTVKHPIKVNVWGCFSSNGFGRIYWFWENLNSDLLCTIYKRCLLPTARDQLGRKSTDWKLQEDNDPKHTSKLANQWKSKYRIQRLHWPSMSPDLNPYWKRVKASKDEFGKKKSSNVEVIICSNQEKIEKLSNGSGNKSGAKYEKSYFWRYC